MGTMLSIQEIEISLIVSKRLEIGKNVIIEAVSWVMVVSMVSQLESVHHDVIIEKWSRPSIQVHVIDTWVIRFIIRIVRMSEIGTCVDLLRRERTTPNLVGKLGKTRILGTRKYGSCEL